MRYTYGPLFLLVACGGPSVTNAPEDASIADAGADAATEPESPPPARLLVSRGVAGAEQLFAVATTGSDETALSSPALAPLCEGKLYCNLPPDETVRRFLVSETLSDGRVVYLDASYWDGSGAQVVVADATTGSQTVLSTTISWPTTWPGVLYGFAATSARSGDDVYFSLPVEGGWGLFVSRAGAALEPLASLGLAPGEAWSTSTIAASASGLAWMVTDQLGDVWHARVELLSPTGAVLASWLGADDVVTMAGVGSAHAAAMVIDGSGGHLEVVDLPGGARHTYPLPATYYAGTGNSVSPDGARVVLKDVDDAVTFDLATGAEVDRVDTSATGGRVWWADDTHLIYLDGTAGTHLDPALRDVVAHATERAAPLDDKGYAAFNPPLALFPGGVSTATAMISVVGTPFWDLADNTGIAVIDRATHAVTEVEPASNSEFFHRQLRLSKDSKWLLYLQPVNDVLQVMGYELGTGIRRQLTSGPSSVRTFEPL